MIPDMVKNLFTRRTRGRVSQMPAVRVSGALEAELNAMLPGDVLEMAGKESGREYAVVLREDLEHVMELARMRMRK